MKISAILNPPQQPVVQHHRLASPPLSPNACGYDARLLSSMVVHGKPRSRFSDVEDAIICDGVAKGLTWGQISRQLPHRKRATCFNRYRTLQGIRKSRRRSSSASVTTNASAASLSCGSSSTSSPSPPWVPSTPPDLAAAPSSSSITTTTTSSSPLSSTADLSGFILPSPHQILHTKDVSLVSTTSRLPPLAAPTARYACRPFTPY